MQPGQLIYTSDVAFDRQTKNNRLPAVTSVDVNLPRTLLQAVIKRGRPAYSTGDQA